MYYKKKEKPKENKRQFLMLQATALYSINIYATNCGTQRMC